MTTSARTISMFTLYYTYNKQNYRHVLFYFMSVIIYIVTEEVMNT